MKALKLLNSRPIAVYPVYIDITGSVTAGLLLSQVMYWFGANDSTKYYKTDDELMSETKLSVNELRTAKIALKELPFLTITREGIPAKTFYEINWDKFEKFISSFTKGKELKSTNKSGKNNKSVRVKFTKQDKLKPQSQSSEIHKTLDVKFTKQDKLNSQNPIKNNNYSSRDYNRDYTETTTENLPPISPKGETEQIPVDLKPLLSEENFFDFVRFRKEIKHPLTSTAYKMLFDNLRNLAKNGENLNECIKQSIECGYRGVFSSKKQQNKPQQNYFSQSDMVRFGLDLKAYDEPMQVELLR